MPGVTRRFSIIRSEAASSGSRMSHITSAYSDRSNRVIPIPGRVVTVHGSVVDIAFPAGRLPAINEAVAIEWDLDPPVVAEVQQHLGPAMMVRAVALGNTAGLRRSTAVRALGAPIRVPVGEAVLGRLLNAIGEPEDRGSPLPPDIERRAIHAPAPALDRQSGAREIFHTGIKVIDLLAPLVKGGKAQHCREALAFDDQTPELSDQLRERLTTALKGLARSVGAPS